LYKRETWHEWRVLIMPPLHSAEMGRIAGNRHTLPLPDTGLTTTLRPSALT
jgi:hypothetical protein